MGHLVLSTHLPLSFRHPVVMFKGRVKLDLDMCFVYPSLFLSMANEEARRIDDVVYDLPLTSIV